MALGTFKWFDVESGYGLISPDDGGRNLFVRSTDMASSSRLVALEKDTKVAYEVHQGRNGTRARNVSARELGTSLKSSFATRGEMIAESGTRARRHARSTTRI
jgi:cold shock protein